MSNRLPARVALLALLYGTGGALLVAGAVWPADPRTPVVLAAVLGVFGLGTTVALVLRGNQLSRGAQHVLLGLLSLLVALLAARSATAAGIVGLGPVLIGIGLYAAHFSSVASARLHVLLAVSAASAGALVATPTGFLLPWLIAVLATAALTEAHARLIRRLQSHASTDPLTGVANRRAWEDSTTRNLARAGRTGEPLSVAILDLDEFKVVNDRDGHSAGDHLLRQVTGHWQARLRASDLLGRYGGDEFVVSLPGTDAPGARLLMQRLDGGGPPIGWSVGMATARHGESLDALLQRADAELYLEKAQRRSARR